MRLTVFRAHPFEQPFLLTAAQPRHALLFAAEALSRATAIFVGDAASAPVLEKLTALGGIDLLVRAAAYDQIDTAVQVLLADDK